MIFFLGASLFLVNISAYAQTTYYTTAGIPESSTLTLRAWPSHVSQPIANIPHNTSEIMPTGKNILLNEDNWLQVAFENKVGWVEEARIHVPFSFGIQYVSHSADSLHHSPAYHYLVLEVISRYLGMASRLDRVVRD